jgi:hypothetical protein
LIKLDLDPLVSENEKTDWFLYDDESLNFLINMEKVDFEVAEVIKTDPEDDNKVYFQDKYRDLLLDDSDTKAFYLSVSYKNVIYYNNII